MKSERGSEGSTYTVSERGGYHRRGGNKAHIRTNENPLLVRISVWGTFAGVLLFSASKR